MNSPAIAATRAADPSRALAGGIAAIRYENLPAATVSAAQRLVLDSLAVALAGRGCEDVEALFALVTDWGGNPQAALLGSSTRVPAPAAALVNGTMIQALDFDDTHDVTAAHTASTVLAAALAVCEARNRSGRDLLAAVTAGVEMSVRVGLACAENIGWTSTAVYGAFGAAAAAAHALGLDAPKTRHAFGIVISQTAGTTQTAIDWPLSKHMQSGFSAKAGVLSALLAERGVTGVENVFEGKFGFFRLYKADRYKPEPLYTPWGRSYHIDDLSLKPYPSCRATHAPIDAALALAPLLEGEEAKDIRIVVPAVAHQLVGKRFDEGDNPMISAQFSIEYTVATALLRRSLSLAHFRIEAIRNPDVRSLMRCMRVEVGTGADFAPATIEITTASGKRLAHTATALKGGPATPLSETELAAKILDCLDYAPPNATNLDAAGLRRVVDALPKSDAAALIAALTPRS
ncbi:MAG: MmgE/PrpD family protein [Betaproteobacteria bacterium]|nr:MmgE/PrpD family protein [Betaproteobacteria bacterium]